ncbi:unnamed protein product [Lupinus luteus]|uniref:Uncharacterized protein n=1 Tax=Lupinus luteus TaxID=3873 RepID=A0AAV1XVE9_LUPLU
MHEILAKLLRHLSLMDPTHFKKIQAMNRYKRREFLENLYFYSLTALTCSVFCCVTLCLPYLSSMIKVYLFVFISSLIPFLLNSKLLFIIGNLVIFALILNSRTLSSYSSSTTNVYYDEYIHSSQTQKTETPSLEVKGKILEKHVTENVVMIREDGMNILELKEKGRIKKASEAWHEKEEDEPSLFTSSDELNRRAENFIARMNRQRRIELSLLNYGKLDENIAGKVVHITGASSGIGEHLAYEYARRGARLALSARRETALREVADRARDYGSPDVIIMRADVSKVDDCRRLVDETLTHFGRLDHLVNNAAISLGTLFEDTTDITNLKPIMETNFWGSVYTTRFALPHLRNSRGKIVVMSSADSWLPAPRRHVYSASKAALVSLYETLRVEIGSDIGITIVTPGYIESELTKGKFFKAEEGKVDVDQDLRDVEVSAVPVGSASCCAKAIVNSTLRGDRYLTVPAWFKITYVIRVLFPEIVEWGFRMMYMTAPGTHAKEAPSKKILDATGLKKLFYPSSIQSPEVKTE